MHLMYGFRPGVNPYFYEQGAKVSRPSNDHRRGLRPSDATRKQPIREELPN